VGGFRQAAAKRIPGGACGIDIYKSGGSMDPADAYTAFRGHVPSPDALLEKEGLDGG
jgi:Zn-dependent oligopeptidase